MKTYTHITLSALLVLVLQLFLFQPAHASGVRISWEASPGSDVTGYKVYYGTSSRTYDNSLDAGSATTLDIDGLDAGVTYYVAVTAYDAAGNESVFSEEVNGLIPANAESASGLDTGSGSAPGSGSSSGGGGGGGCFISASMPGGLIYPWISFLICAGIVFLGGSLTKKFVADHGAGG